MALSAEFSNLLNRRDDESETVEFLDVANFCFVVQSTSSAFCASMLGLAAVCTNQYWETPQHQLISCASQNCRIVPGAFTPVLAKHSKNFSLQDSLAIGVDRMQRNFEPMRRQTEQWRQQQLSSATAKLLIYRAFIEGDLQAPKHLAGVVHDLYFNPKYEEFQPRTMWSLSNAFTSAFKELEPIPQFKATAKLGAFLETTAAVAA